MTQTRLNHCMILKTYKKALGEMALIETANKLCGEKKAILNTF